MRRALNDLSYFVELLGPGVGQESFGSLLSEHCQGIVDLNAKVVANNVDLFALGGDEPSRITKDSIGTGALSPETPLNDNAGTIDVGLEGIAAGIKQAYPHLARGGSLSDQSVHAACALGRAGASSQTHTQTG